MNVAIFVPALVGGILLFNALIWGGIFFWFRSRTAKSRAAFADEIARTGERVVIAIETANYAGGSRGASNVGGTGQIALTDRRLWFQKLTGGIIEIPISNIAGARVATSWRSRRRGGRQFLILATREQSELAFSLPDTNRWMSALQNAGVAAMGHP